MRHKAWLSMLSIVVAASVVAQDRPDFSGRWVLESPSAAGPDVARSLTVRQPIVRTNVSGAPMEPVFEELTVERRYASGTRSDTYRFGVGGTVGGGNRAGRGTGANGMIPETRVSLRWDGSLLVLDTGSYSGPTREAGPYTERTEVWQLNDAGRLVLSVTSRGSGVDATSQTLTYRKE